jgi:hypothetical protein
MVGGQDLVSGLQVQRAGHDVHARGGIGHEDQVLRLRAQGVCQGQPRLCQQLEASMREASADPATARPLVESIRGLKDPITEKLGTLME